MTFNSVEFALLLVVVLAVHWSVAPRHRNAVVLVASYLFYGWWDARFLSLLALSTVVDFGLARALHATDDERRRRALLVTSLAVNLGLLAVFKYAGFFVDSLASALARIGLESNVALLQVVLPVGISFYTFQTISYTFDVYRRRIPPTRSLLVFATYVAYFPQLVAGPIERAQRLLPQIQRVDRPLPRGPQLQRAVSLIAVGLFRKVVLADGVAPIVNEAFDAPGQASWIALATAAIGFSIQIYGDFSGYSNMARGVSLLLGIDLMTNFREPYLSRGITEFWQRWHISLSTWLRDYLYIPLGGNRGGTRRTMRNLMLTMLLGGLWHGAAWTFVLWGGLHGTYLAVERLAGLDAPRRDVARADLGRILLTFALVTATWVVFRADTVGQAVAVLGGIATLQAGAWALADVLTVAVLLAVSAAVDLAQRAQDRRPTPLVASTRGAGVAVAGLALGILVFSGGTPEPFIYFQF